MNFIRITIVLIVCCSPVENDDFLTLLSSEEGDFCVTNSTSAMYFITDNDVIKEESRIIPPVKGDYCNFENSACDGLFQGWSRVASDQHVNLPVFDFRWEGLPLHEIRTAEVKTIVVFDNPVSWSTLFSVRCSEIVFTSRLSDNPIFYSFYLKENFTLLEKRNGEKHLETMSVRNVGFKLNINTWSHFQITKSENRFVVFCWNNGEFLLDHTFRGEEFNVTHLAVFSRDISYVKLHKYGYLTINKETNTRYLNPLPVRNGKVCVAFFSATCKQCSMNLVYSKWNEKSAQFTKIVSQYLEPSYSSWTYHKFSATNLEQDIKEVYLSIETTVNLTNIDHSLATYWSIDDFRTCSDEEYRITQRQNETRLKSCHLIQDNRTVVPEGKNYIPQTLCDSESRIGKACISCEILKHHLKSCENFKICDGLINDNQCYCSAGYADDDCKKECSSGYYGYDCQNICGNCDDEKACNVKNGFCNGCSYLFTGKTCDEPRFDEMLLNPPVVMTKRPNSCTVQFGKREYRGATEPKYFMVQYQELGNNLTPEKSSWLDGSKINLIKNSKPVKVESLKKSTMYGIRILISHDENQVKNLEKTAKIPFVICNTTCIGLEFKDIEIIVDDRDVILRIKSAENKCDASLYRWELLTQMKKVSEGILSEVPTFNDLNSSLTYSFKFTGPNNLEKTFSTSDGIPGEVENLNVKNFSADTIRLEWDKPSNPNGRITKYVIKFERLRNKYCDSKGASHSSEVETNNTFIELKSMIPYSIYRITVRAENRRYKSKTGSTKQAETSHLEMVLPQENLNQVSMWYVSTSARTIQFGLNLDCAKLLGPLTLLIRYNCLEKYCIHANNVSSIELPSSALSLNGLQPYCSYNYTISLLRFQNVARTSVLSGHSKTSIAVPNKVTDLMITAKGSDYISIRWLPPYPPTGQLVSYRITSQCKTCTYITWTVNYSPETCVLWPKYHCVTVTKSIAKNMTYSMKIEAANSDYKYSSVGSIDNVTAVEESPDPPYDFTAECINNKNIKLSWKYPNKTNGNLKNFRIELKMPNRKDILFKIPITKSLLLYIININITIPNSVILDFQLFSCNSFRSLPVGFKESSYPPLPVLVKPDSFVVQRVQKTNFQVSLNVTRVTEDEDSDCYLLILITDTIRDENTEKLEKLLNVTFVESSQLYLRLAAEINVKKLPSKILNYIIGEDDEDTESEVLKSKIVNNRALEQGQSYNMTIVLINIFGNKHRFTVHHRMSDVNDGNMENISKDGDTETSGGVLIVLSLVLLVLITTVIGLLACRKRITPLKSSLSPWFISFTNRNAVLILYEDDLEEPKRIANSITSRPTRQTSPSDSVERSIDPNQELYSKVIEISNLEKYVRKSIENGDLEKQHAQFPRGQTKPCEYGVLAQNKSKNRYNDLIAYDHTRVVLEKNPGDEFSDYINANYIDGYKVKRAYIAAQGPKQSTLKDFWKMIWQENVKHIVMVANIIESGKKKVEQYWPKINEELQFGHVYVRYSSVEISASFEYRVFNVRVENEKRKLYQYHFTTWPDHGVPMYPQYLVPFIRRILKIPLSSLSPILVHCSAGVGRTGTILLCDISLRMAIKEGTVDMLSILHKLREQRSNMVDNEMQYKLAHLVILEHFMGLNTSIPCLDNFEQNVKRLIKRKDHKVQMNYLKKNEWQDKAMQSMYDFSENNVNYPEKNRRQDVIPGIVGRVLLRRYPHEDESSAYINAIQVDGFRFSGQFIVTQNPLPNTVGDFWRLVVEQRINVIISLNEIDMQNETNCNFWPRFENLELQPVDFIVVQCIKVSETPCYNIYTINVWVEEIGKRENLRVEIAAFRNWPAGKSVPPSCQQFLSFWEETNAISRQSKVVVTCFDGVLASGLYLALTFVIEKMKLERDCDVCLAVRNVRLNRKQFVTDKSQFIFLYHAAVMYIKGFESYANFRK